MNRWGILFKDFKSLAQDCSQRLKAHAQNIARQAQRPFIALKTSVRKEDEVRKIIERDGLTHGLVCVFSVQEPSQSFRLRYGEGKPRLTVCQPRCQCLYFYYLDREFGLLHVRIPTWFPFTIQVCLNGHEWLARQINRHAIAYTKVDNAFAHIADPKRAQRFADRFVNQNFPRILEALARKINPILKDLLHGMQHYWVIHQAEYPTDVLFQDSAALNALYQKLREHATLCFSAEDVLIFLGRKLNGNFEGEVLNDARKRPQGTCVTHRMKGNWIKMYDKYGCVLRIETVINHPYEFRVRRRGKRQALWVMAWYPMTKGVSNLYRYAEVSLCANRAYLDALAVVDDPGHASGKRLSMILAQHEERREWADLSDGCYLLRTNLKSQDAATLWKTYIGLSQIEDRFRISKHDLDLRPIYHQRPGRTQAGILVCFLALVMWRTLEQWMRGCGLGTAPRKLLEEMAEVRSLDVVLLTSAGKDLRLRIVSRPEQHLAILLQRLGLLLPNKPKSI